MNMTSTTLPNPESEHLDRIRLGILALPVSAALIIASLLLRGPLVDPPTDPVVFAENAVKPTFVLGAYGVILAWVIVILGFPALFAFLQTSRIGRLGFSGMVFSLLGVGLFLPILGVVPAAFPEVGSAYLRGEEMVMILTALGITSNMTALSIFVMSILLHTLGSILFAIGILRCHVLPTWAGFLYALHAPLIHFSPNFLMELTGAALLLVSGVALSFSIWKRITVLRLFGEAVKTQEVTAPRELAEALLSEDKDEDEDEDDDIPPWERNKKKEEDAAKDPTGQ